MSGDDVLTVATAVFAILGEVAWFLVGRAAGIKAERARVAELNAVRYARSRRSA